MTIKIHHALCVVVAYFSIQHHGAVVKYTRLLADTLENGDRIEFGRQFYEVVGLCDFHGDGLTPPILSALEMYTEEEYTPGHLPRPDGWPELEDDRFTTSSPSTPSSRDPLVHCDACGAELSEGDTKSWEFDDEVHHICRGGCE